jgi:Putative Flp pilus-assembly TadE/G-like
MGRFLRDQRAGVTVIAAALIPVMLIVGLVLHDITAIYKARGEAQTAADAGAKAAGLELSPYFGVGSDPRAAAGQGVERNGGILLECSLGSRGVLSWITVKAARPAKCILFKGKGGLVSATARCYLDPLPIPSKRLDAARWDG